MVVMPADPASRVPLFTAFTAYFAVCLLTVIGHLRDLADRLLYGRRTTAPEGYAPLLSDYSDFYTRRGYQRFHDCWNRPICSSPSAWIDVMERAPLRYGKPLTFTGNTRRLLNLGSYNYLGFGSSESPTIPSVLKALEEHPVSTCSARSAAGTSTVHADCEQLVARFLDKEAAMVFGMGYGTNSTVLPALVGPGCLIVSDAGNHSSIAVGARSSQATIRVFRHNDPQHLEQTLRRALIDGQPQSRRPWRKILIVVEGIYSMEGEMCPLRAIVDVKNRYGAYLYLDEAHSIGAIGKTGRGICEYANVDTRDVDVMMGTFTKSFGAVGGYVASSAAVIAHLRHACAGSVHSASISIPACQQALSAIQLVMGEDGGCLGQQKLQALRDNANYFRSRLLELGCHVLGDCDSPVVPVMLYNPAKIPAFSRECYARGLAVVVVGFPATPLLLSRTRFCISAAHSKQDLHWALTQIEDVADLVGLRYARRSCACT